LMKFTPYELAKGQIFFMCNLRIYDSDKVVFGIMIWFKPDHNFGNDQDALKMFLN